MNEYLYPPKGIVDAVLDTDAYNEIDDQFAIAYMLRSTEAIRTRALFAAPFHNERSESYADGMEKSYHEIKKLLSLMGGEALNMPVFRGSTSRLPDEKTPVDSDAARELVRLSLEYNSENRLYVVAIGALTNVASAFLLDPTIKDRCVVVWLGANGHHYPHNSEFNLGGDIAAARVVMGSKVPFVSLPCVGVVSAFTTDEHELRFWLGGKNPLADYLVENTVKAAELYAKGRPWTRVIWDVCAVAFLTGADKFLGSDIRPMRLPTYDHSYEDNSDFDMRYVYEIRRDALFCDLVKKIVG